MERAVLFGYGLGVVLALRCTTTVNAQYTGGTGRGDVAAKYQPTSPGVGIFAGGTGRGDHAMSYTPAPFGVGIFAGGTGRGDHAMTYTPAPPGAGIFAGGTGRGDHAMTYMPAPPGVGIFAGGSGRGDQAMTYMPAPPGVGIFAGGTGRGDHALMYMPAPLGVGIFAGGTGRGDIASPVLVPQNLLLALRGLLEGPYNSDTGLMSDALRAAGLLPTAQPYSTLGYTFTGGGDETTSPAVLAATGNNAIIDWVVVELRTSANPSLVSYSCAALMQRDGDVTAPDGNSPLSFPLPPGNYQIALKHRNHLGVMTLAPVPLGTSITSVDLTLAGTATFGTAARKGVAGAFPAEVLWAGDANSDGTIMYTGSNNDRDPILQSIGGEVPTNVVAHTYAVEDVNMDGKVKYTGPGNDRDPILLNIGATVPTTTRSAQLP